MLKQYREPIIGKYVTLREVKIKDAKFILSLRCDEKKSKFLHKTDSNVEIQKAYIENYFSKNEYYFIVENKNGVPIGTTRIYDITDKTFTIGSWLMSNEAKPQEVIEAEYLCRMLGFDTLNLPLCRFVVSKENKKVVRYHKMVGSKIVDENDMDYFFESTKEEYLNNIRKFLLC